MRSSSLTRDWTRAPYIGDRIFTTGPPRKSHYFWVFNPWILLFAIFANGGTLDSLLEIGKCSGEARERVCGTGFYPECWCQKFTPECPWLPQLVFQSGIRMLNRMGSPGWRAEKLRSVHWESIKKLMLRYACTRMKVLLFCQGEEVNAVFPTWKRRWGIRQLIVKGIVTWQQAAKVRAERSRIVDSGSNLSQRQRMPLRHGTFGCDTSGLS